MSSFHDRLNKINADFHRRYARSWGRHDAALSATATAEKQLLADAGAAVRDRQAAIRAGLELCRLSGSHTFAREHAHDADADMALSAYTPPPVDVPPPGVALSTVFDLPAAEISPDRVELSDSDRRAQAEAGADLLRHLPATFGKPA